MPVLRLDKVSLAFGHRALLDGVDLELRRGERVCLVGRNGEGKSSLLRVISEQAADEGEVWLRPGMRIATLAQEVTLDSAAPVFDVVAGGLGALAEVVSAYHHAAHALGQHQDAAAMERLADLQHKLEAGDGLAARAACGGRVVTPAAGRRGRLRHAVRRQPPPRVAGARAGERAGHPAAGRADQSPRHRGHHLAGKIHGGITRGVDFYHPRPDVRATAGDAHHRARPGPADFFPRRLRWLPAQEGRASRYRDPRYGEVRQEDSPKKSVDPPGIKARRTRNEGRVRALQACGGSCATDAIASGRVA